MHVNSLTNYHICIMYVTKFVLKIMGKSMEIIHEKSWNSIEPLHVNIFKLSWKLGKKTTKPR